MPRRCLTAAILVYAFVWAMLLPTRLAEPPSVTFSSDASEYNLAAVHLARESFYSLNGSAPYVEREPGYSAFLAILYLLFGVENRLAIFLAQGLLYLIAILAFTAELQHITPPRVARLSLFLLATLPVAFHVVFSVYREGFALSLAILSLTVLLALRRAPSLSRAIVAGGLVGALVLTYLPFLFSPLALGGLLWCWRMRARYLLSVILLPAILVAAWGARNASYDGRFRVVDSFRTAAMWYARGEQAQQLRGWQPLRCLVAEYVSRDWSGLPAACTTNGLINTKWPGRVPIGDEDRIVREGQAKIVDHLPSYLWFALFEVLELHLPFVDGWGYAYNIAVTMSTVILALGCLLALPVLRRGRYGILLVLPVYSTVVFALTDATPRYLVPSIFCYVVVAALGYTACLQRIHRT